MVSNSNASPRLVPWFLSLEDIQKENVGFDAHYTCQVAEAHAPSCIKDFHGVNVALCRTNGNGKCGLHAVLGVPSARELKVNDERALLLRLVSETHGNVRTRLQQEDLLTGSDDVQALDDVWSKFRTEFINPLMEQEIKGIRLEADRERSLYWQRIMNCCRLCGIPISW